MTSGSGASIAEKLYHDALDLLAQGKPAEAAELLRQCLQADPAMLDAMHGLIRALQDAGNLEEALVTAHRLAELDPDDPLARTSLSILYQRKGMIVEAEAEALKAKLLGWKKELESPEHRHETGELR